MSYSRRRGRYGRCLIIPATNARNPTASGPMIAALRRGPRLGQPPAAARTDKLMRRGGGGGGVGSICRTAFAGRLPPSPTPRSNRLRDRAVGQP